MFARTWGVDHPGDTDTLSYGKPVLLQSADHPSVELVEVLIVMILTGSHGDGFPGASIEPVGFTVELPGQD